MQVTRQAFSSVTMTKNMSINHEEQKADSVDPMSDARHGLHLIPSNESGMRISLPAEESLRELIESFRHPHQDQRQSPDDDLLPAAS